MKRCVPSHLPSEPQARPREVTRLVDILPHVDALVLDGFGVINVGASRIDGIIEFFEAAAAQKVPVMVLTNGAGQGATPAGQNIVIGGCRSRVIRWCRAAMRWKPRCRPLSGIAMLHRSVRWRARWASPGN